MISRFISMIGVIVLLSGCLIAQSYQLRYRIAGVVRDENQAVIKGVTVKFVDKTGNDFGGVSGEDGIYSLIVPAGIYSVTAENTRQRGWKKYSLARFEVGNNTKLSLDITLNVDLDFVKLYGTPVPGVINQAAAGSADKLIELVQLDKAIVEQKLIPIVKAITCNDPSQLYVFNYGSPIEIRRRVQLIAESVGSRCEFTGSRMTFIDGPAGSSRTVVWKVPNGAKVPTP